MPINFFNSANELRKLGNFDEAYELILNTQELTPKYPRWVHHPFFWKKLVGGKVILTRRSPSDATFLRKIWKNKEFLNNFNCLADELPQSNNELIQILFNEYYYTIDQNNELHWIIRDQHNTPWGILSLIDISLIHKKAEILIGVLPGTPISVAPTAMLTLIKFYFDLMKFNKIYSYVRSDNVHSLKGTLHLGFKLEGTLCDEIFNPIENKYATLYRTGLLKQQAQKTLSSKLAARLLKS